MTPSATDLGMRSRVWVADALVKLQRAMPRAPGDSLGTCESLSTLLIRIAALLPSYNVSGLGDEQQVIVSDVIAFMIPVAIRSLQSPLTHLTPALVDLLRSLSQESAARTKEREFVPKSRFLPGQFRTHRYGNFVDIEDFVDGLARAELAYDVNLDGMRKLHSLAASSEFFALLDEGLPLVTFSLNQWALALLFDGLRLRRGLEIAAPCGLLQAGQRAPFGLDGAAASLLTGGEASVDRERVGRAAQFLIAAAQCANLADCVDPVATAATAASLGELEHNIYEGLRRCRATSERRCLVPGKSMRLIIGAVVEKANLASYSEETRLALQYAFCYPCIVPCNIQTPTEYDGGLLSVWDACSVLLKTHARQRKEILTIHALLCAVLGGIVGHMMSERITGPFCLHPQSDVARRVNQLNDKWPGADKKPTPVNCGGGKRVGATAAVCDAIQRRVFKRPRCATACSEARAAAALTMHVINSGLASKIGASDGQPTDGVVSLKQLYLAALHAEPGTPVGRQVRHLQCDDWDTSAFADGVPGSTRGAVPDQCVNAVWREVIGGACLASGPLFCFSRRGLQDSLLHDWKPKDEVARALRERAIATALRPRAAAVMLPSHAMELMAQRARRHVAAVVTAIDNNVKTVDGPPIVTRVVEALNAWSNAVYSSANLNPLWESAVAHFCSPETPTGKRRR